MHRIINQIVRGPASRDHAATFYQGARVIKLSLGELDSMASRLAERLRGWGLTPGDRIGILARNCLEWVLLDLAALKLKLVTAGFEHGAFEPTPALLSQYGLKRVFTDHQTLPEGFVDIRALSEDLPASGLRGAPVSYAEDDATTIKFTSGSTGSPKGLAATVGSIDSSIDAVQELFHHTSSDRLLVFLPLSLLQQRYWIYSALYFGHDVVVAGHEFALYACKREEPTVLMGVPSFFDAFRQKIELKARGAATALAPERAELLRDAAATLSGGRVRYLWTGSAPAKPDMLRFYNDCRLPIFEGYGMNETCIVSKNAPDANRVGSVGRLLSRKRVSFTEEGMLVVSSDYPVNRRYLFATEAAQKIFASNGDVLTGDLGRMDEDGYLYITGRADDFIALGNGKNVFARRIEELARQCDAIAECVLSGAGRPHLVAVVSPVSAHPDRSRIERHIEWVNQQVSRHERIGGIVFAREPFSADNGLLTSQGKPKRARIREEYRSMINASYGESNVEY
jgi:long-subunit acyl-CoA synthetase (AMP-forming)